MREDEFPASVIAVSGVTSKYDTRRRDVDVGKPAERRPRPAA